MKKNVLSLSPRLQAVADMVIGSGASSVADIGTDHAYVPIYLVQNGMDFAVACDIREGPAVIARANVVRFGLEDKIDVRIGFGLEAVGENEVSAAVIAGMGGIEIGEILARGTPAGTERFVLQPMTAVCELRRFLAGNGFDIIDEVLVRENDKIYNVMSVEFGECDYISEADFLIGRRILEKKDALLGEFLEREIGKLDKKIGGLKIAGDVEEVERCEELRRLFESLRG